MRCPRCGTVNAAGARFCARCGAALPAIDPGTALHPGQTMNNGQFRIVRQLGKGGMGTIYLAENTHAFDRLCVIKEMIAYYEPGDAAKASERFEREARTLAALKHPGIPDMYGFFSEGGHHYIVMEYIEGDDLEHALERSPQGLDVDAVVRYAVEICRVLEYLAGITPEPVVPTSTGLTVYRPQQPAGRAGGFRYRQDAVRPLLGQSRSAARSVSGTAGTLHPSCTGEATPRADVFRWPPPCTTCLPAMTPRHPFSGRPRARAAPVAPHAGAGAGRRPTLASTPAFAASSAFAPPPRSLAAHVPETPPQP